MSFPTLPSAWIDQIFATMAVSYGSDWFMKWEGIEEAALRAKWATDLGAYINRGDAIKFALDHLPVDKPPNSLQFRVICMGAPRPDEAPQPQLPSMSPVKADISRLKSAMERYKELRAEAAKNPRGWAKALRARERAGEDIGTAKKLAWRAALRVDDPAVSNLGAAGGGTIEVIPNEALPPGMRKGKR